MTFGGQQKFQILLIDCIDKCPGHCIMNCQIKRFKLNSNPSVSETDHQHLILNQCNIIKDQAVDN